MSSPSSSSWYGDDSGAPVSGTTWYDDGMADIPLTMRALKKMEGEPGYTLVEDMPTPIPGQLITGVDITTFFKPCKFGRTSIFSFLVILIFMIGAEGDEVLLRVEKVSICGSDISLYTLSLIHI